MKERIAARAPGVLLDAKGRSTLFESTHRAFRTSSPIFGPMLSLDREILPRLQKSRQIIRVKK